MRDFSSDHRWLSLNTATVRKQGDLAQIVDACARHGIRAIDPWREQVAAIGLDRAVRAVRDAGLELSGYCRGGLFTSDAFRSAFLARLGIAASGAPYRGKVESALDALADHIERHLDVEGLLALAR